MRVENVGPPREDPFFAGFEVHQQNAEHLFSLLDDALQQLTASIVAVVGRDRADGPWGPCMR